MRKKSIPLTESEEELMNVFWSNTKPLTSVEIIKLSEGKTWNGGYVHIMLSSLLKKHYIKVVGTVRYDNHYVRKFVSAVTKQESMAKMVISRGVAEGDIAKIAVAMAAEAGGKKGNEKLIKELESIIDALKQKDE